MDLTFDHTREEPLPCRQDRSKCVHTNTSRVSSDNDFRPSPGVLFYVTTLKKVVGHVSDT